jgi:hypothetical protein
VPGPCDSATARLHATRQHAGIPGHKAPSALTPKMANTAMAMASSATISNDAATSITKCCLPGDAPAYQVRASRYRVVPTTAPHPQLAECRARIGAVNHGKRSPLGRVPPGPTQRPSPHTHETVVSNSSSAGCPTTIDTTPYHRQSPTRDYNECPVAGPQPLQYLPRRGGTEMKDLGPDLPRRRFFFRARTFVFGEPGR